MRSKILFILAALYFGYSQASTQQGVVTRVSDGDTLWLRVDNASRPIKLRLQGIDAPEICQSWGVQARDAARKRLLRQTVNFEVRAKDDFNRSLGRLTHQGEDIGAWLVKSGHAWSYSFQQQRGPYASEQSQAQAQRIGLWAQDQPVEPRRFRRTHGPCPV